MDYPTRIIARGSPDFPEALGPVGSTQALYVRGRIPVRRALAVVGTREASADAVAFTATLIEALAPHPIAIWSGGARGIDAAAHRAALHFGLPTVVVMGGGLDTVYPPEHEGLFRDVLEGGGALVARVPDEIKLTRGCFQARNQILAAITEATLVIEAPYRSGARSTSAAARKFERPVFVVPHAPWDLQGRGCALELAMGGRPISSAANLLAALGLSPGRPTPRRPDPTVEALGEDEKRALQVLDGAGLHFDLVVERSGLSPARTAAALLTLTIKAVVVEGPAGSYRWASSSLFLALSPEK